MTVLVRGVLALIFAVPALLWTDVTVPALAAAFVLYAVLAAAGMVGAAVTDDTDPHQLRGAYLVAGLVSALAGLMSAPWPQITGLALAMVVGGWAIAVGLLEVTAALAHLLDESSRLEQRRARIGAWLLAVAGIVVLLRLEAGAAALATVLGVYALIAGVLFLAAAWCLRADSVAVREVR
jgi:uncharacterized membrane protein HdeD (DUF308 family)